MPQELKTLNIIFGKIDFDFRCGFALGCDFSSGYTVEKRLHTFGGFSTACKIESALTYGVLLFYKISS